MSKQVEFEGVIQEFPDDFTDEEIGQALSGTKPQEKTQIPSSEKTNTRIFNIGSGIPESAKNRTAGDVLRDIASGIATGSQNLASSILEGGEYLTRKGAEKLGRDLGNPVNVPYWNAREFMGLEGNNPINIGQMIESKSPDTSSMIFGKYFLPSLAGGPNLLRQMLMQGTYGASQASPEQKNLFGILPEGRLGAGIRDAASIFALGKLLPSVAKIMYPKIKNAFTRINPREVARSVQATHDSLLKQSEEIFQNVGSMAKARGADTIKINPGIIDKVKPYLANTRSVHKFLEKARSGDYESLRKLQADLFRSGTKAENAGTLAEDLKSQEIFDLRDMINESISKHFKKNGHNDLANMLDEGRKLYRNLKQTYYNKKLPAGVRNLVHPDVRKIPKKPMNVFSEESKPMERLVKQNPLLAKKLEVHLQKQNALENLKTIGKVGAILGGAAGSGYIGKKGFDYFTGQE